MIGATTFSAEGGEQTALLLSCSPADRSLKYAFALFAGLRRSELADLRWGDLRLNAAPHPFIQLRQEQTKNGKADVLPLHPYLSDLLKKLPPKAATDRVVSSVPDMKTMAQDLVKAGIAFFTDKHGEGVAVRGGKRVMLADASGQRVDFHSLRHTFATCLDRVGCSTTTRKALLRHADEGVTERYTHARLSELFEAIQRLPHPQVFSLLNSSHSVTGTGDASLTAVTSLVDHRVDQTLDGQGHSVAGMDKKNTDDEASCLMAQLRYTSGLDVESQPLAGLDVEHYGNAVLSVSCGPSTQVGCLDQPEFLDKTSAYGGAGHGAGHSVPDGFPRAAFEAFLEGLTVLPPYMRREIVEFLQAYA